MASIPAMRRSPHRRLVSVAAAALALAACSGGGGKTGGPPTPHAPTTIIVTSGAFEAGAALPAENTCHGAGNPPDVAWRGVPANAKSVALVVTDPDAPNGTFVHWLLYNLPPKDGQILDGAVPQQAQVGRNSGGGNGWTPPCPPSGTHHYQFAVYALDSTIAAAGTADVIAAIDRHAVASGMLTGLVSAQ